MSETLFLKRPEQQEPQEETLGVSPASTLTLTRPTKDNEVPGNFYKTVPVSDTEAIDLNSVLEDYNRPLIKEDFLKDERLQELIIQNMETRFRPEAKTFRRASGLTGAAVGGFSATDYRERPFEEVFELWQNYQRSFDVGQSVTVANEVGYTLGKDDETRRKIGAGYLLFDSMDNAFTGEGSWSEMSDAIWDYGKGVVFDPTTLATLGIGKAMSAGATKASSALVRKQMVELAKKGIAGKAAVGLAKTAPYVAPDLALNVGIDVLQQNQLIRTEAAEKFDAMRTGLVAAGSMAIPALIGGAKAVGALRKSKGLKDTVVGYTELTEETLNLPVEKAWKKVSERTNKKLIEGVVDENFGKIKGNPAEFLKWIDAREEAGKFVDEKGSRVISDDMVNSFFNYLLFGKADSPNPKGFVSALKDSGFEITRSMMENQKISGIYGQAMEFLSDEVVEKSMKTFEEATGVKLGIDYNAKALSSYFIDQSRVQGQGQAIRSKLSRLEKVGLTGKELAEEMAGKGKKGEKSTDPKRLQFGLSTYKRLLTSHLSTTGANLKGFTQLVSLNTYSDIFASATYAAQGSFYRIVKGDPEKAMMYGNKAWGSIMSTARKPMEILSPDLTIDYADKILEANPSAIEKLFRDVSGDGGVRDSLSQFNLDPSNKLYKGVDSVTKGAQTIAMVRLQDEVSKRWAFGSNLDRNIMREYGVSPSEFWKREDAAIEMASYKFQNLMDQTIYKTLRETASVNWSTLPGKKGVLAARNIAKSIETLTNKTPIGFIVPFGSFMNTTIATLGDLSGVNAMRYIMGRVKGKPVDFADQDFGELMGKAAAGWTATAALVPQAIAKIQNGLSYNQEVTSTGEVQDRQFDWPASTMLLSAQMVAHSLIGNNFSYEDKPNLLQSASDTYDLLEKIGNGTATLNWDQIPEDLWTEFAAQAGPGQAVRDLDDAIQGVAETFKAIREDPGNVSIFSDVIGPIIARPVQGMLRPLDPVNTVVGLARDSNMNPDLKQGQKNLNQAFKYINQMIPEESVKRVFPSFEGVQDLPRQATPTRGTEGRVDLGKQVLGNRTAAYPNITESVFNSAGIPNWKATRWTGPEKVKNYMDGLAAPLFEQETILALKKNPDYFKSTTEEKQRVVKGIQDRVRTKVLDLLETQGAPKTMDFARLLAGKDKEKVRDVIDKLGYEGDIDSILEEEDAFDKLQRIKYFVDNYDDIFYGDLK